MILSEVGARGPTRSRSLSSGCAETERKLDPPKQNGNTPRPLSPIVWRRAGKTLSPFNPAMIPCRHQVFKNSPSDFHLKNAKETRFPAKCSQRYPRISPPSTPQRKEFSAPTVSNPLHLPPTAGATADGLVTLDHVSLQEFCPALSKQSQGHLSS